MKDHQKAIDYANEVSQAFITAGVMSPVFVVRGPTSTTKMPFEVVDATAGYTVEHKVYPPRSAVDKDINALLHTAWTRHASNLEATDGPLPASRTTQALIVQTLNAARASRAVAAVTLLNAVRGAYGEEAAADVYEALTSGIEYQAFGASKPSRISFAELCLQLEADEAFSILLLDGAVTSEQVLPGQNPTSEAWLDALSTVDNARDDFVRRCAQADDKTSAEMLKQIALLAPKHESIARLSEEQSEAGARVRYACMLAKMVDIGPTVEAHRKKLAAPSM